MFGIENRGKLLASVSTAQGPNYALAKFIQRWRTLHARGSTSLKLLVSSNVGPGARTHSVMHATRVGAALEQLHYFKPNEFYDPETVCAVVRLVTYC